MHPIYLFFFIWHRHGHPFRLDQFSSLVYVHLRSNVVRVCSSFWSFVMANSLVVHIMLKKESEVLKVSVQPKFIGAGSNTEHLGLSQSYLPHPNSKSCTVFFMDSLFFKEYYFKFSNFFSTVSTGSLGQLV